MFNIVNLYDGIYRVLANDKTILNYLGMEVGASNLEKSRHLQKRSNPQNLANHLPLISFYAPPGERAGNNHLSYSAPIIFDVITDDDVELAHDIVTQIVNLFDGEINPFDKLETFEAEMITQHESRTDLPNTYCFTTVILFGVSLD